MIANHDIRSSKKAIRKRIRELLQNLTTNQHLRESEKIVLQLSQHELWQNAQTILAFSPLADEPDIFPLISNTKGKTILLPVIKEDTLEIKEYKSPNDLAQEKRFGVLEPTGKVYTDLQKIDLVIVPGVAFTKEGKRLGRGKGYYDKLLKKLTCPFVGISFSFQILDNIPTEEHDVILSHIISA